MKVRIWSDDIYPVYGIDTNYQEVEIPDELYQRYLTVEREYGIVQEELEKYSCAYDHVFVSKWREE